jgi:hypothetical protein
LQSAAVAQMPPASTSAAYWPRDGPPPLLPAGPSYWRASPPPPHAPHANTIAKPAAVMLERSERRTPDMRATPLVAGRRVSEGERAG